MKVVVIGAGIAGLGAAGYFQKKGHDVLVLEGSDRVGGRAIGYSRPGTRDRVDTGTQYFHSSYRRSLRLIDEAGLRPNLRKVRGYSRVFDNRLAKGSFLLNRLLPWYGSTGIPGNLRLGLCLAGTMINYHMDPFTLDVRARADDVAATDFYTSPVVHLSITRALALVGALSEPEDMGLSLHHLHRLIHIILFTDYLSLASGTDSLHEAIAARLPVRLESPAVGLLEEGGRITGVELENERIPADHVVVATTPSAAASLIPPDWNPEREFLSGIKIPSFTLPTFFLDRPLEKNVWSYLLHQHNRKISYLTDAAQKNPEMVPSGKAVIQPWVCYPHSAELAGCSDEDIIKLCTDELEDIFPGFGSWIEEVHITRHPYGVPFHSVGHVQKACDFMKRMDRRKVSFCGDYFSGGYVESALWSAERAAKVFG